MFSDLITPKSFPDRLQEVAYDPLGLMPPRLEGDRRRRPRLVSTPARLARAKSRIDAGSPIDVACYQNLLQRCALHEPLPETLVNPADWGPFHKTVLTGVRNGVAWLLNGQEAHRLRALQSMRLLAAASLERKWSGFEFEALASLASLYDILAAGDLAPEDDRAFRHALLQLPAVLDLCGHRFCNNHNVFDIHARLSLGVALDEPAIAHDALYGLSRNGQWRYGLVHQLRHDILADGMQWEGCPGYHMLVMGGLFASVTLLENCGIDLWHRGLPALNQNDGHDEHRGWGPRGVKRLRDGLDALIYQAFANGDYSQLHDQVLGNLAGTWVWCPLFAKGFEVYQDPRYAWVLQQTLRAYPQPAGSPLPAWLTGDAGQLHFLNLECRDIPQGENPYLRDRAFSIVGRHERGCSLFPVHGSAHLRANPADANTPGAMLYFGPHWAGHRAPASLHLEIHAAGRRLTHAPHIYNAGYEDPRHLLWNRSTIAHNTVTVDQTPMLPFEFETDSPWECDSWRDTITDSELLAFQGAEGFAWVRARNQAVYAGVTLDRTVVLAGGLLIDLFRVSSDRPRLFDWALHCHGRQPSLPGAAPIDLGQGRGYRYFTNARLHPDTRGPIDLAFDPATGPAARGRIWLPAVDGARLILADDPDPDARTPIADRHPPGPRCSLIVRARATSVAFLSAWSLDGSPADARLESIGADAAVTTRGALGAWRWKLPAAAPVTRDPLA